MTQLARFSEAFMATKGGVEILSDTSTESLNVTNNVNVGGDVSMITFTLSDDNGKEWQFSVSTDGILETMGL
jgi:hypothetical protein